MAGLIESLFYHGGRAAINAVHSLISPGLPQGDSEPNALGERQPTGQDMQIIRQLARDAQREQANVSHVLAHWAAAQGVEIRAVWAVYCAQQHVPDPDDELPLALGCTPQTLAMLEQQASGRKRLAIALVEALAQSEQYGVTVEDGVLDIVIHEAMWRCANNGAILGPAVEMLAGRVGLATATAWDHLARGVGVHPGTLRTMLEATPPQQAARAIADIESQADAHRADREEYAQSYLRHMAEASRKEALVAAFAMPRPAAPPSADELKQAIGELEALTGLREAKDSIRGFVALLRVQQARGVDGTPAMNLVFSGGPGTGKTTVARLLGRILAGSGLLADGHLVEVSRSDLVAGFIGQTAPRVHDACQRAVGGVLFIDEAYALANGKDGQDFGREAIDTLVKEAEDLRGNLAIVLAGYPDQMQRLIDLNPGLRSRFNTTVNFVDYSPSELLTITEQIVQAQRLRLSSDAEQTLAAYYAHHTAGAGRLVRNLVEAAERTQALRLQPLLAPGQVPPSAEVLAELTRGDIEAAIQSLGR